MQEKSEARVYATAVFLSDHLNLPVERLQRISRDVSTPEWRSHVERSYRCALRMVFNPFYERRMRVQYLLGTQFDAGKPIGIVWCDWVLVKNRRLRTESLHVGFRFGAIRLDLDDPKCPRIEAVSDFLAHVYQLSERDLPIAPALSELSRVLQAHAARRKNALGLSRYMYSSVLTDDPAHVVAPSGAARVNFYRLLYMHSRGVGMTTPDAMLPPPWSSAAFFRLYSQPGGVLSIAQPYPEGRETSSAWFEPQPPTVGTAPRGMLADLQGKPVADAYAEYDLLPEYPPLRYLTLPASEYVAAHEETLRAVHEAAFSRYWLRFPSNQPAVRHLQAANLEGIRLPIMRDLVNQMLERQLQARTSSAAKEMLRFREGNRTIGFAAAGIVLTLLFADYEKTMQILEKAAHAIGNLINVT